MKKIAQGLWNGKDGDELHVIFSEPYPVLQLEKHYTWEVIKPDVAILWEAEKTDEVDVLPCDAGSISLSSICAVPTEHSGVSLSAESVPAYRSPSGIIPYPND